jgi:hypothetical protein
MIRIALPVVFTFLVSATMSRAQSNCPEDFRYVGTLSGNGSGDAPLDARKTLKLPPDASLDVSFQQKAYGQQTVGEALIRVCVHRMCPRAF